MTKSNIVLILILVAVVSGTAYVWWGPPNLRLVYFGDLTASFAGDLHDFVFQSAGRLPTDWQEFERWEVKTHGRKRWGASDTSKRMRIMREPYDISSDVPRFIEVTDPDIKGMEVYINREVENARLLLNKTNNTANKSAHGTR